MHVRPARLRPALIGLAAAVVLTGCAGTDPEASESSTPPSSGSPTSSAPASSGASSAAPEVPAGQRIEVSVASGQVTGDTGRVPVPVGEQVTLVVTSDAADELHLHGYDLTADLVPGQPAEVTFAATIPGVFEAELHEAGTVLLSLQVG